jgi:hypothetical protein
VNERLELAREGPAAFPQAGALGRRPGPDSHSMQSHNSAKRACSYGT